MGAKYLNDKSYAVKYADVVSQSFQSLKNITTGEGGMVLVDSDIAIRLEVCAISWVWEQPANIWNPKNNANSIIADLFNIEIT